MGLSFNLSGKQWKRKWPGRRLYRLDTFSLTSFGILIHWHCTLFLWCLSVFAPNFKYNQLWIYDPLWKDVSWICVRKKKPKLCCQRRKKYIISKTSASLVADKNALHLFTIELLVRLAYISVQHSHTALFCSETWNWCSCDHNQCIWWKERWQELCCYHY